MKKALVALGICALATWAVPAEAGYKYLHAEGEYIVELPDAPTAETIWAHKTKDIPFLKNVPKFGDMGEYAYFERVDSDTGDVFEVEVIFLKAEREFLETMTKKDVEDTLRDRMSNLRLRYEKINVSGGSDTLKWGTYSGYSTSRNNETLFNVAHFMVGLDSITYLRASYNVINEEYNKYYTTMAKSLKYLGQ